jgi:hypothetical protein
VRAHFDFLADSGFRFDHVDHSFWVTTAVYLSSTLGLEVTRSVEFSRVEITLLRLVDGQPPEPEIWVTDRPINRTLFDDVLVARAPHLAEQVPTGLSKREVDTQLRLWAELLRSVAPDFLEGNDAAIVEAEQVVRQRVAENPQELTVWLPSDATDADEQRAREEAERTAPGNVRVTRETLRAIGLRESKGGPRELSRRMSRDERRVTEAPANNCFSRAPSDRS